MDTIQTKGSFTRTSQFLQEGGMLLKDKFDNKLLNSYCNYLRITTDNKEITITYKLFFVNLFDQYLINKNKNFKTFSKEDAYDYFTCCSKLHWGLVYQNINKLYIKMFFNWSYENHLTKISGDMILPKIVWYKNTNVKTSYSDDEIIKMLNAIDIKTNQGKEDYLILSLICNLGLRISDVVNLKLNDIDFNENEIKIIQYKTGKLLTLPLIESVRYPLLDYLKNARTKCDLDYIFVTHEEPYRQYTGLKNKQLVKKYLLKAGININGRKHGYHSLRHSFSTLLLKENTSLYSISTILGHEHVTTTMDYLDIDTSKLKELALEVPDVK